MDFLLFPFIKIPVVAVAAGILQYNPIQSAISQNLIGPIFATELDYIVKCPQCVIVTADVAVWCSIWFPTNSCTCFTHTDTHTCCIRVHRPPWVVYKGLCFRLYTSEFLSPLKCKSLLTLYSLLHTLLTSVYMLRYHLMYAWLRQTVAGSLRNLAGSTGLCLDSTWAGQNLNTRNTQVTRATATWTAR